MAGVVHNWPAEIAQLIAGIKSNPEQPDSYFAIADVTREELTIVALFEVAARNGRVRFLVPDAAASLVGCMNPIVGLGPSSKAARVRISFHDVSAE
jgi:hypothetical protein